MRSKTKFAISGYAADIYVFTKPLYSVLKKEALCGLELFIDRLARTLSSISINNRLIEGGQHYEKGVARFFVFLRMCDAFLPR